MDYMPFNSVAGDRIYKAEDWAWYFGMFISNGVFANPTSSLQVVENSGMSVKVKPGAGFINGYAFRNTSEAPLTLDAGDGTYDRIDRIVLRWDLDNRMMLLAVKKGTAAASPVAPALTRTSSVYELALADIAVARGAVSVSQVDITDQRANTALCNFCVGMVDQIDWSDLTAQLSAFMAQTEEDLMDYMQDIHDILDSETASHLLNLINGLQASKVNKSGDSMTGSLSVTGNVSATGTVSGGTVEGDTVVGDDVKTSGNSNVRHLSDAGIIYTGVCTDGGGSSVKHIQLTNNVEANTNRPIKLADGALFAIKFDVDTHSDATAEITGAGVITSDTINIIFPRYEYAGEYILFRLDGSSSPLTLKPVINAINEVYFQDADLNIYPTAAKKHAGYLRFMHTTQRPVQASSWSGSTDANGYYTNTVPLAGDFNGYNGVDIFLVGYNGAEPTAAEIEAYNMVENRGTMPDGDQVSIITLYAKTKPSTTFYIDARGTYLR